MATAAAERPAKGGHPKLAIALVVLASLLTFFAMFSIWVNRQALNTDNWVDTSGRLLANHEVDEQLSNYLATQLLSNDDLKTTLEAELPEQLKPLGGALAGGLTQLAPRIAERALENPKVQALWSEANRLAHERLLEVLDGGNSNLSTENGEVTLDLSNLVEQVGKEVGVGSGVADKLPPAAGRLVILKSDQLAAAQTGAHVVRGLPIVLTLLALILFGVAVWIAGPRRRKTLRGVGIGLVVSGALILILRSVGGDVLVDAVVKNPTAEPAVHAVWDIATSLLVTVAASAVALGILVFLGAWLAGPTGLATSIRRASSPYLRESPFAAGAVAAAVWLALIAWAPIAAFRKPLGILLFAILFALGAWFLRRQTLREFPEGERVDVGAWLRGAWSGRTRDTGDATGAVGEVEALERLGAMHRGGELNDAEFAAAKARLIAGPPEAT